MQEAICLWAVIWSRIDELSLPGEAAECEEAKLEFRECLQGEQKAGQLSS